MDLLKQFKIDDRFLGRYIQLIKDTVLPYQEKALNDAVEGAPKSHAVENFRAAAQVVETGTYSGGFYGMIFQDSDVAKWLEAAAYSLSIFPDSSLESRCDSMIRLIGRAQQKDGYLNTYFTVKEPGRRWTNLCEAHELYCAGHMIEAAVAYAECTGKTEFLDIVCRMADHIYNHFIENKAEGYPGHPEIELALVRLYEYTKQEKYLRLACHFIDTRGVDPDYFIKEHEKNQWTVWNLHIHNKEYAQNHAPVRSQQKAVGHAVRALYLYSGMASVAAKTKDKSLIESCRRLWANVTRCQMYVTGAVGSCYEGEAFTKDFHLPNDTAYGETCASIALIFFARRMLSLEKNSVYADVMERALYNCVLAGMALDGTKFFYVNPLEVIPGISGEAATHPHTLPVRQKWFTCACCPPNIARLLPSISRYTWSIADDTVYAHLFIGGTLTLDGAVKGKIHTETDYPYSGTVNYTFEPAAGTMAMTLAVRLPFWSSKTEIFSDGQPAKYTVHNGYAHIHGRFTAQSRISVRFDMSVRQIFADSRVSADSGKTAVSRGPLIYCLEGTDNGGNILDLYIKKDTQFTVSEYNPNTLCGIVKLYADGIRLSGMDMLYSFDRPKAKACRLTLIPYYAWANRGLNQMRVWIPEI